MTTLLGIVLSAKDAERFWSHVDIRGPDECWPWKLFINKSGYGQTHLGGRKEKARTVSSHRLAAALSLPDFDEKANYLHSCDNRSCCNPVHLSAGTHLKNMAEMTARDRNRAKRPGSGFRVIADETYSEIKRLADDGKNKMQISRLVGVSIKTVRKFLRVAA